MDHSNHQKKKKKKRPKDQVHAPDEHVFVFRVELEREHAVGVAMRPAVAVGPRHRRHQGLGRLVIDPHLEVLAGGRKRRPVAPVVDGKDLVALLNNRVQFLRYIYIYCFGGLKFQHVSVIIEREKTEKKKKKKKLHFVDENK
jgi:hypothetical protein